MKRFRRWLDAWLAANDMTGDKIARKAKLSPRIVYAIRRDERKWLHLSTVDAILCAAGETRLLGCFHALPGEKLKPVPRMPRPAGKRLDRSTRCCSGDDCARPWGHGPNGRFCKHHGEELDRVFAALNPKAKDKAEFDSRRRKAWVQGKAASVEVTA